MVVTRRRASSDHAATSPLSKSIAAKAPESGDDMRSLPPGRWPVCATLLVVATAVSGVGALRAQEQRKVQFDQYGDPLPEGALARLGTLRLVHMGGITSVAVSPDNKIVASGVREGKKVYLGQKILHQKNGFTMSEGVTLTLATIRLWETASGKLIREIETPDAPVSCLQFAPTGNLLYAGCGRYLCAWNASTGEKLWAEEAVKDGVFHYGVEAKRILVTKDRLISVHEGRLICPVEKALGGVSFFYHPQKAIRLWDSRTGKLLPLPQALESTIHAETRVPILFEDVAVSIDGKHVAALVSQAQPGQNPENNKWTYTDRRWQVVDLNTSKVTHTFRDDEDVSKSLTFFDGRQTFAFATDSDRGKDNPGNVGGASLAAHGHGNTVHVQDRDSGKPLHSFEGHRLAPSVRFALHSKDTLISHDGERVCVWDARSWKARESWAIPGFLRRRTLRWFGDMNECFALERQLYATDGEESLELREIQSDRLVRPLEHAGRRNGTGFSAAGNRIVVCDDCYTFLDVETGKKLSTVPKSRGSLPKTMLSPQGRFFAKNDRFSDIDLFDVSSGKHLRSLAPEANWRRSVLGFDFSADERFVVAEVHEQTRFADGFSSEKVTATLWDVDTGKVIRVVELWPEVAVNRWVALMEPKTSAFTVSNDQRFLAFADQRSERIEIWEVASGTKRGELAGHAGQGIVHQVVDLAFSHDNRRLVSSSEDTTILVWDMDRPLQPGKFKNRLAEDELTAHWQTLLHADAAKADTAIWGLVSAAQDALPFLKKHLQPVVRPDPKRVENLLNALDSDEFAERSKAETELKRHAEFVRADLEEALRKENTLARQKLLEKLLQEAQQAELPFGTPEKTRRWRALEVLERIGTAEAKQILRDLADGAPGSGLTVAAQAVLKRLDSEGKQD